MCVSIDTHIHIHFRGHPPCHFYEQSSVHWVYPVYNFCTLGHADSSTQTLMEERIEDTAKKSLWVCSVSILLSNARSLSIYLRWVWHFSVVSCALTSITSREGTRGYMAVPPIYTLYIEEYFPASYKSLILLFQCI